MQDDPQPHIRFAPGLKSGITRGLSGCGAIRETNQAACERTIENFMTCASPSVDAPPELDFFISYVCGAVPETTECADWPALADCMAAASCTGMISADPQALLACNDIQTTLTDHGCFPQGF